MKRGHRRLLYHSFEEMIEKYNPFGFKEADGEICLFDDYKHAYLDAMQRMFKYFPKGIVDCALYLHYCTGMPYLEAVDESAHLRSHFMIDEYLDIDYTGQKTKSRMEPFLRMLHEITETKFDKEAFDEAFELFELWMENQKVKNKNHVEENS